MLFGLLIIGYSPYDPEGCEVLRLTKRDLTRELNLDVSPDIRESIGL